MKEETQAVVARECKTCFRKVPSSRFHYVYGMCLDCVAEARKVLKPCLKCGVATPVPENHEFPICPACFESALREQMERLAKRCRVFGERIRETTMRVHENAIFGKELGSGCQELDQGGTTFSIRQPGTFQKND